MRWQLVNLYVQPVLSNFSNILVVLAVSHNALSSI